MAADLVDGGEERQRAFLLETRHVDDVVDQPTHDLGTVQRCGDNDRRLTIRQPLRKEVSDYAREAVDVPVKANGVEVFK